MRIIFLSICFVFVGSMSAKALLADLSSHEVEITTSFTGASVLLFGTTERDGDVVVVVRGPEKEKVVRRKERVAGLWMNVDYVSFKNVPSFYSVACNQIIEICARPSVRSRHQIGLEHLKFPASDSSIETSIEQNFFKKALLENMKNKDLYPVKPGKIDFLGQKLFRTHLEFPANVPTGTYYVEVFELKEGKLVGALTTPLIVKKVGMEAAIYNFAHQYPALYGLCAIIIALLAGWGAGLIFRKD